MIQVPWEGAFGAQGYRRHSSHLETPHLPILILARAGRGALGTLQDPKSLHEAFAQTGTPWQVTRNRGWHLSPQGPSPTPTGTTRNEQQCCQTVAVPASGTRMLGCHPMKRGAAARRNTTGLGGHLEHPTAVPVADRSGAGSVAQGRPCQDWCWPHHGCKDRPQHSATAHGTRHR